MPHLEGPTLSLEDDPLPDQARGCLFDRNRGQLDALLSGNPNATLHGHAD